jgi:hypothetical protein
MIAPDWLAKREGALKPGIAPQTWMVTLRGHPLYKLFATPAQGKFTCAVTLTNNGQRLDAGKTYPSLDAAVAGGLEELREKLGW